MLVGYLSLIHFFTTVEYLLIAPTKSYTSPIMSKYSTNNTNIQTKGQNTSDNLHNSHKPYDKMV